MDFQYKSQKELQELTPEQVDAYQKEVKAHEKSEREQEIKSAVDTAVKSVEEKYDADLKAKQDHLDKLDIKMQGKDMEHKSGTNALMLEIKSKKNELKSLRAGVGSELEIKANVTVGGSITDNASGFFLPTIGQLGVKERTLYTVLPKRTVSDTNNGGKVRYYDWDEDTIVRAAAAVAEGAAFPESTAAFRWYSEDLKKIGDTLPVTDEFFEDESLAAGELSRFLQVNVETKIDSDLVNANGVGTNIKGLLTYAPSYTAVASGISAPNLKDLTIKVRNDITRSRGSKYNPDMVLVSSSTMEDLVLAKDANNNYIFDENTGTLGGLFVVIDENMPDNQIIVGERRYAEIWEKPGAMLSRGTVNAQFTSDMETLKVRKRLLLLVRNVDKTGFRKVTDVDAALATLAI